MQIIPYIEIDGTWTFTDTEIKSYFYYMQQEKTAKKVFHGGAVKDSSQFLTYLKSPANHTIIIINEERQPIMLAWLNGVEDKRAWFSFNVFKNFWGKKSIEAICLARDYWMNMQDNRGQFIFNVLMGVTPSNNRLALRMMKLCGATSLEEIPDFMTNFWTGERVGGIFSYFGRT